MERVGPDGEADFGAAAAERLRVPAVCRDCSRLLPARDGWHCFVA